MWEVQTNVQSLVFFCLSIFFQDRSFLNTLRIYKLGLLKHFAPWEHILLPGSYFGLRVSKHFWIKFFWFFWSKYLNKFSIKTWYSSKYHSVSQDAKCFNTLNLYTTGTHFYNSSINIGSISFSHLLTCTNPTIYRDATLQALILHLILF